MVPGTHCLLAFSNIGVEKLFTFSWQIILCLVVFQFIHSFFFVFVVDIHSLSCYAKNNYKGAVEAMKGGLFIFNLGIDIFLSIKQLVHVDLRSFVSSKQFVSGFVGSQQNLYTSPWDRTRSSSNISHFQNFCRHCFLNWPGYSRIQGSLARSLQRFI